jgi:hypothetical protein
MEAFVYRWRHTESGMWYIGFHKGTADDGYICSSKTLRPMIQSNPSKWTRKILRYGTRTEMVKLEHRLLKKLKATQNPNSYNKSLGFPVFSLNPGRKKGSIDNPLHPDLHSRELVKLKEEEIVDKLINETVPERRFLIHKFLFKRIYA